MKKSINDAFTFGVHTVLLRAGRAAKGMTSGAVARLLGSLAIHAAEPAA